MSKNLTNSEIVKALECCTTNTHNCLECPYKDFGQCEFQVMQDALDLINRLQAENTELLGKIEGLEANRVELLENIEQLESVITQIKAEAYKEFAEELHNKAMKPEDIRDNFAVGCNNIDNLLKKLVGDSNA